MLTLRFQMLRTSTCRDAVVLTLCGRGLFLVQGGEHFWYGTISCMAQQRCWCGPAGEVFSKLSKHCLWCPRPVPGRDLVRTGRASLQERTCTIVRFIMRVPPARYCRKVGRFLELGSRTTFNDETKVNGFEHLPYVVSNKKNTERAKSCFLLGCGWCRMRDIFLPRQRTTFVVAIHTIRSSSGDFFLWVPLLMAPASL